MALKTTLERLEELETAMTLCLKAQSSGQGDKTHFMVRYRDLSAEYNALKIQYASEQGTGGFTLNSGIMKR